MNAFVKRKVRVINTNIVDKIIFLNQRERVACVAFGVSKTVN